MPNRQSESTLLYKYYFISLGQQAQLPLGLERTKPYHYYVLLFLIISYNAGQHHKHYGITAKAKGLFDLFAFHKQNK